MSKKERIQEQIEDLTGCSDSAASELEDAAYEIRYMDDIDMGAFDYHADFTDKAEVEAELDNLTSAIDSLEDTKGKLESAAYNLESALSNLEEAKRALEELIEIHEEQPDIEVGQIVKIEDKADSTYEVIAVTIVRGVNFAWLKPQNFAAQPKTALWSELEIQE